jgi:hypothetical protein
VTSAPLGQVVDQVLDTSIFALVHAGLPRRPSDPREVRTVNHQNARRMIGAERGPEGANPREAVESYPTPGGRWNHLGTHRAALQVGPGVGWGVGCVGLPMTIKRLLD